MVHLPERFRADCAFGVGTIPISPKRGKLIVHCTLPKPLFPSANTFHLIALLLLPVLKNSVTVSSTLRIYLIQLGALTMKFNQDIIDELNILMQYDLSNTEQGIKIHHDANQATIAAAARLFDKGLTDKADGGYLTALGRTTAEHALSISGLLATN